MNNKRKEELETYLKGEAERMFKTWQYLVVLNEKDEFTSSEKAQNLIVKIWIKTVKASNVKDEFGVLTKMTGMEIFHLMAKIEQQKNKALYNEYISLIQ